jgi:hypothetical protein
MVRNVMAKKKLYVVITTTEIGDDIQYICDVVKITDSKATAKALVEALCDCDTKALKKLGVDDNRLCDYEDADFFERNLNGRF